MNKAIVFAFLLVACLLLAFWAPWSYLKLDLAVLFGVNKPEEFSGLVVYSLAGDLEVFIDGENKGVVKADQSFQIFDNIKSGERLVTLKKVSENPNNYWNFSRVIQFEKGVNVVASFNIGPREEFSEGHIIYAVEKLEASKPTLLDIKFNIDSPIVLIDSAQPIKTSLKQFETELSLEKQHKISISKDGYETLEFSFLPDTQEDRDKFKTYDINMDVFLMHIPIELEEI